MGYIHSIQLNDNSIYLIEPILHATASGTAAALTANINNFELVIGTNVNIKVGTVDANATLNVSNTGAKEIHYNNEKITANQLKANHIYTFVYDGTYWQIVGDIDTDTWRGIQDNLTSDSTTDSLSAKQGKVLKGLIDAMDATTPAADGNATAFIDSITQTDGKITSITKKNIPTASTSTPGIIKIGTTANDAAAGNHNHDSTYSYRHLTDYDFTDTQPLSKYVTFDKSKPVGAPREEWYNGFISSHNNYHASYIINGHTHQDEWYVGHGIWREANTPHASAPTWYLLAHSGNVGTGDNNGQVKIAGQNVSVKGLKALAYKDSLAASDIPDIGNTYLKLSGGIMTGDIKGNASVALGTTTNPFHNIVLGGATNATLTADSTNPRITFQESNNGTQPVHLIYSDYNSYRSPAGLKIIGGTSASPAWLEVEGNIYANSGNRVPNTGNTTGSVGGTTTPVYVDVGVIKAGTTLGASAYHADSYFALASHDHNRLSGIGRKTSVEAIAYNPSVDNGCRLSWLIYDSSSRTNDATNSPSFDASVLNLPWDWGGFNGQIAISSTLASNTRMQIRSSSSVDNGENANPRYTTNYGVWREVVTATKATKVGDTNKPVYISETGQATAISYTIGKSVPSDAVFTDHYDWDDITNKPTTLSGYGITDAASSSHSHTLKIGNKSLNVSTSEQEWTVHDILKTSTNIKTDTSWDQYEPGVYYVASSATFTGTNNPENANTNNGITPYHYGQLIVSRAARGGVAQFYISHNDSNNANYGIHYRTGWDNTYVAKWSVLLDSQNYTNYAVAKTVGVTAVTWDSTNKKITKTINGTTSDVVTAETLKAAMNITASDLDISNALHFIGITSTILADGSTTTTLTPKSTGSLNKTTGFVNGDVVMDGDQLREYVWSGDAWRLLGITTSTAYTQPASTATNTWIAQISQGTDGKITATTGSLDTSGTWSGNAATATAANLTSTANAVAYYTNTTGTFGSKASANGALYATSANGALQWGTLPIAQGGTGVVSFTKNQVILSDNTNGTTGLTSRAYSDSTSAGALSNTSTNFVTERDIYFGLPQINNLHNYTSNNNIFAPITGGLQYQILVSSSNTTAPLWATYAFINSAESAVSNQQAFTTLTLGNNVAVSSEIAHSEGRIELYSAATSSHIVKGDSTTTQHTHILPNSDGHIAQTPSAAAVGSPTQPVYIAANGVITPLVYVPNRLYYSTAAASPVTEESDSFTATIHYADNSHIGLGASNWPENCTDTLYVTGTTSFNGNVYHKSNVYFGDATNYYIDATATGYLPDLRVDKIQLDENYINFYSHVNANNIEQEDENQSHLLLGYIQGTNTGMLFHRCTLGDNGASATDPQNLLSQYPIFKFNGHLLPEETNTNDLGANLFRWKDAYFQGNIYMQNVGTPRLGQTNTANKIIWNSAYHDAEIYFSASQSDEAGKLVLHSKPQASNTNGRLHSTIAIAFDDNDTAYINYSDPSFYPAVNNSGYLGLSTNRWNKVYIGDNDIYGDDYTPIYWNDGAPKVVAPVQQYAFTISANTNGVNITHEAFTTDTYVLQIVITYGMENLNAPLTWNSYDPQGNQLGGIQLQCSALTSGLIQGYVITSRGKTYDVSNNMTNYFTPINP